MRLSQQNGPSLDLPGRKSGGPFYFIDFSEVCCGIDCFHVIDYWIARIGQGAKIRMRERNWTMV